MKVGNKTERGRMGTMPLKRVFLMSLWGYLVTEISGLLG